jgi:hypothetical protein
LTELHSKPTTVSGHQSKRASKTRNSIIPSFADHKARKPQRNRRPRFSSFQ